MLASNLPIISSGSSYFRASLSEPLNASRSDVHTYKDSLDQTLGPMTRRQLTALATLKHEGFFSDLARNANSGYAPTKIVHFKAVQSV